MEESHFVAEGERSGSSLPCRKAEFHALIFEQRYVCPQLALGKSQSNNNRSY